MDTSSEPTGSDSFNSARGSISSRARGVRISWFKRSFSRRSKVKRNPNVGKTFPFSKSLLKLFVFGVKNFCKFLLLHIDNLHGNFQFGFNTVFGKLNAFYYNDIKIKITKKENEKHSHYLQTGSEKNKSQGRPRRTQREQTLSFGATMHDFSGWSGLAVL